MNNQLRSTQVTDRLHIGVMQWNDLSDIDEIEPLNDNDVECLEEVKSVLEKHGMTGRFGVNLLHKHFELKDGECLVEYVYPEERHLSTVVKRESELKNAIQTTWRFDTKTAGVCDRRCSKWCEPRTGTTGHWGRHKLAGHLRSSGGGGGGGGCFPKGTRIKTPFGSRDISTLEAGDFVIAINAKDGQRRNRKILKKLRHTNRKIWLIDFGDGSSIRTTSLHSFSISGRWRRASEIKVGDVIASLNANEPVSQKTVVASCQTNECEDVYNIIVEKDFTFVANDLLAHSFTYCKSIRRLVWSLRESLRFVIRHNWKPRRSH